MQPRHPITGEPLEADAAEALFRGLYGHMRYRVSVDESAAQQQLQVLSKLVAGDDSTGIPSP